MSDAHGATGEKVLGHTSLAAVKACRKASVSSCRLGGAPASSCSAREIMPSAAACQELVDSRSALDEQARVGDHKCVGANCEGPDAITPDGCQPAGTGPGGGRVARDAPFVGAPRALESGCAVNAGNT
jgi:hypothetical protein